MAKQKKATTPTTTRKPRMATDIPGSSTIPNRVDKRLGTLNFFDGFPDDATVEKVTITSISSVRCRSF